jgi:hypothetical protein
MGYSQGMMGSGAGMMGYGQGMVGSGAGMMGYGRGIMGTGQGMMGSGPRSTFGDAESGSSLTLETIEERLADYLAGNDELEIGEVMIFDNHGYAQIMEEATNIGAMEVLVDPLTLAVVPEHGPNMMWNLKYGMMRGGWMGGMMGFALGGSDPAEMPVSEEGALELARAYLDG